MMCVRRRNYRERDEPPEFTLEEAANFAMANEREGGREVWSMTEGLAQSYADEFRYPHAEFIAELRRQGIEVTKSKRKRNQELLAPELDYEYGEWVPVEAVMFNDDGSVSLLNAETDMEVVENPDDETVDEAFEMLVGRYHKELTQGGSLERWTRMKQLAKAIAKASGMDLETVLLTAREAAEEEPNRGRNPIANPIEAYGAKGMKSTPWRKIFKDEEALNKWLEKNDAEVYGVRDVEESR